MDENPVLEVSLLYVEEIIEKMKTPLQKHARQ
jgi:hypothetical protein